MLHDSDQNSYTHQDICTSATSLLNFGHSFLLFITLDTHMKFRKGKHSAVFQDILSLEIVNSKFRYFKRIYFLNTSFYIFTFTVVELYIHYCLQWQKELTINYHVEREVQYEIGFPILQGKHVTESNIYNSVPWEFLSNDATKQSILL